MYNALRVVGRPLRSLTRGMERNDGCGVWSNILCANTRLGNAKSSMLQEINPDAACMYCIYARTAFYTYSDQHVLGLVLCAGVITLCCAVLCCAVLAVLMSIINDGILCSYNEKPPATLAHKEEWNGITDVVDGPTFWERTGDLQKPRAPCSRKTTWTPHACTYILFLCTLIGTYLVCCFVQGDCAVLCCAILVVLL